MLGSYGRRAVVEDSPTQRAAQDTAVAKRPRHDRRIALGSPHQRTRKAHQMCGGGCGHAGELGHEGCATGCGTHNPRKCGGRNWANKLPLSQFAKSDATLRIAIGIARARRWKEQTK